MHRLSLFFLFWYTASGTFTHILSIVLIVPTRNHRCRRVIPIVLVCPLVRQINNNTSRIWAILITTRNNPLNPFSNLMISLRYLITYSFMLWLIISHRHLIWKTFNQFIFLPSNKMINIWLHQIDTNLIRFRIILIVLIWKCSSIVIRFRFLNCWLLCIVI